MELLNQHFVSTWILKAELEVNKFSQIPQVFHEKQIPQVFHEKQRFFVNEIYTVQNMFLMGLFGDY